MNPSHITRYVGYMTQYVLELDSVFIIARYELFLLV
jgi:hypothetical protein